MGERVIEIIKSKKPIGCCKGHTFKLIAVNNGYTTECTCGMWCGQWYPNPREAINYFNDMINRYNKEV